MVTLVGKIRLMVLSSGFFDFWAKKCYGMPSQALLGDFLMALESGDCLIFVNTRP